MKKLFLSFVLIMIGLVTFAQCNYSEYMTEIVSTTTIFSMPVGGHMEREGRNLKLDGRILSDSEVRDLVGEANYETYLGAKKQITKGKTFQGIFIGSAFATVALLVAGIAAKNTNILYFSYIPAIAADVSLPLMCIFSGIGKGRMNWVADEYNGSQSTATSYSLTPSVMRVQDNTGLGLTFGLSF